MFLNTQVGGRPCNMLIDTGASVSITSQDLPLTRQTIWIEGVGGERLKATLSQPVEIKFKDMVTDSQIWVCPEQGNTICSIDLLKELGGVINPRASCIEWAKGSKQERLSQNIAMIASSKAIIPEWGGGGVQ
ncbi:unnamed protein product [Eretmochelys imbricata]